MSSVRRSAQSALRRRLPRAAFLGGCSVLVSLACGTQETRCLLVPDSLDFGAVTLGEHAEGTFRIINDGETRLELEVAVDVSSEEFTLAAGDTVLAVLAPGDSLTVSVRFAPASVGPREAQVAIRGAPCGGIGCRGLGVSAACGVEPVELDFGRVLVGEARERAFVIRSTGDVPLEGAVALSCDEFRVVEGGGWFSLPPGDSLRVVVELAPATVGVKACEVGVGSALCLGVTCAGEGTRTWEVFEDGSGQAPTIQAAIDSSRHGDVVLVYPGTYYENLNLRGKAIHLRSAQGPEATIIDGSREDNTVVFCGSGESNDTIIEGFTITGGRGWRLPWDVYTRLGGGIHCQGAGPTIRGNIIRRNDAVDTPPGGSSRGGGISFGGPGIEDLPPTMIESNIIEDNFASANGGGINITGPCVIQDNVIRGNRTGRGDGAGVYTLGPRFPVMIWRNLFLENRAGDHGGGVYISNDQIDPMDIEVSENLILRNASRTYIAPDCSGGGIWISGGAHVHHNTIAFNRSTAVGSVPPGGGCCVAWHDPEALIEYNIIYGNAGGGISSYGNAVGTFRANIVFGNDPDVYSHPESRLLFEDLLIVDPLFCDTTATSMGEMAAESPALSWPGGGIGAVDHPSCSISTAKRVSRR